MKIRPFAGLRSRILLLVFAALLPMLALLIYQAGELHRAAAADVEADALLLAGTVSDDQELLAQGARQMLITLAGLPQVRGQDRAACSDLLAALLKQYPLYDNLNVINLKGDVICSAVPLKQPINVADRRYFRQALETHDFAVSSYELDRITGKPIVTYAYPALNAAGDPAAIVTAALDLGWLNQFVAQMKLPTDISLTILNADDGTVLAQQPEPEKWVGKSISGSAVFQAILHSESGQTSVVPGLDNARRLLAFQQLDSASNIFVVVGVPEKAAYASVNRLLILDLIVLGALSLLTLALAWAGTDLFILHKLAALLRATRQLAAGNLSIRTGLTRGVSEISELARDFDRMAEALEQREAHLREAMTRYKGLFDSVPIGLYRSTPDGRLLDANPALVAMLGYPDHDSLLTTRASELYVDAERRQQWQSQIERQDVIRDFELQLRRRDSALIWVQDNARVMRDAVGGVLCYEGTLQDITERKQAAEDLKRWAGELERRNHEITLLNKMGELFHSCLTIDEASAVVASLMPRLFPEARGGLYLMRASRNLVERVAQWGAQPTRPINPGFTPDECWALRLGHAHLVEETASGLVCPHLDWPWPASFLCVPMIAQGDLMGLLHLQRGSASEATPSVPDRFKGSEQGLAVTVAEHIALALSNLRLRETLRGQSIRDSLTGLFNRRYLEETLEREARRAERGHYPIGILVLDIDYFKRYNDTYGHAAGDAVLKAVGAFLKNHTRSADIACRYGGEEFVLVFPEATLEDARQRAEELRQGVQQIEIQHNEQMLDRITFSIGVAAFPQHGSNVETLIQAADAALYAAKSAGRDRVILA